MLIIFNQQINEVFIWIEKQMIYKEGEYLFNLKAERVRKGIKQGEFADKVGITPQYLCLIEKGKVEPRRDVMIKIAKALDTTVVELFFSEEE